MTPGVGMAISETIVLNCCWEDLRKRCYQGELIMDEKGKDLHVGRVD